jgi:AcrR family transcriptional regulator
MRTATSRAKQVEQNDERLMAAARKVFVQRGYHAASLDLVAASAGLTKGAVYARFASKAELMLALLEARVVERTAQMKQAVAPARGRGDEAAGTALARQWAALAHADAEWSLLVLEFRIHAARDRTLNARFRALHEKLRDAIATALASDHSARGPSPDDVARIAMALTDGFALERAVDPDGFPTDLYEAAASAVVKGLRK